MNNGMTAILNNVSWFGRSFIQVFSSKSILVSVYVYGFIMFVSCRLNNLNWTLRYYTKLKINTLQIKCAFSSSGVNNMLLAGAGCCKNRLTS